MNLKVLSQGLLWQSMKKIHQEMKKIFSMLKFLGPQQHGNGDQTVAITQNFFLKIKMS